MRCGRPCTLRERTAARAGEMHSVLLDYSASMQRTEPHIHPLGHPGPGRRCPQDVSAPEVRHPSADAVVWYPMRSTFGRAARMKALLDARGVENFLPMRFELTERSGEGHQYRRRPVVSGLIFVRESKERLTELKREPGFAPLRFYTRPVPGIAGEREIVSVPDKQMADFMRVASSEDERVVLLEETDYLAAAGQRVRVTEGPFVGVEGVVKRIKSNKCVVVRIEGVASVGILHMPAHFLLKINNPEK